MTELGITYYNDFVDINSVANPVTDKAPQMQFSGFLEKDWMASGIDFDKFGYGLKKTVNNQGAIFCKDASMLFSDGVGYVQMILSLPSSIVNGVYTPLKNDNKELNEYILCGINIGQIENAQPGIYAALTPRGIEFTIWTSGSKFVIRDTVTNVSSNTDFIIEFVWDKDKLPESSATTGIRVDGDYTALGNAPIYQDSIDGFNFYVLNTPFLYSGLECTIRKLITYNEVPDFLHEEVMSSTSSSSSSSSSS